MAFPVTLNGRTYTLADFSGTNYVEGLPDAFEDFVTQAGNIYTTTSTSSVAIGSGSKTFTVADSGKPYINGTPLRIADAAAPATNWIDGIVTSYSGTTLVVNAIGYAGSGTISSWNINIGGGPIAYTGTLPVAQGGTGGTTEAAARTNLDVYSKSEADSRFLNVSGEASDVTMTGNVTIGDAAGDTLTVNATATLADATLTTADINGGTIDGTVIGGSTPAAISGTTGTFSGRLFIGTTTGVGTDFTSIKFDSSSTFSQGLNMVDSNASANNGIFQVFRKSDDTYLGLIRRNGTDNAILVNGNSYLALGSGDTERMRITSTGSVGIGTSDILGRFTVQSGSGKTGFNTGASPSPERGNIWYDTDGSGWKFNIGKLQGGTFTPQMTFQDNGNVGIGASSPSYKVDTAGTTRSQVQSGATNNTAPTALIASNATTGAHAAGLGASLQFEYVNSSGGYSGGLISSVAGADPFTADLRFFPRNYGFSEAMRLDASGHLIVPAGVTLGTAAGVYNAANTLDDYEEGTWSPTLTDGTNTISLGTGTYTKIGRIVQVHINAYNSASFSSLNTTGNLVINGFPFSGLGGATSFGTNNPNNINLLVDVNGSSSYLWNGNGSVDFTTCNKNTIGLGTSTASMRGLIVYYTN